MLIREFSERDTEEITLLMKNLCILKGQEFDEERWRNSIMEHMKKDSNSEVFVAFDDEKKSIIGMANCSIRTSDKGYRFGFISNLIVKEEKRRLGIGEEIVRYIVDFFKRNHIHSIRLALEQDADNAAKILFTKLGFQETLHIYELKI
ncbi:hypothetical protein ES704_04024 [subsurface metagenome]|jgi:ribosomal protein S18 acetylase RimI-like enzyme